MTRQRLSVLVLWSCWLGFGCGDASSAMPDAAVEVMIIDSPVLAPCPAGWIARAEEGLLSCAGWESPPSCGTHELAVPGESCAHVGAPCPADVFGAGLTGDTVLHVMPGAAAGDGSVDRPFGLLSEALAVARDGSVIALSKGTHEAAVNVSVDVTLVGACSEETRITATPGLDPLGALTIIDATVSLRDLTITGDRSGVVVPASGSVTLDGVLVEGTVAHALWVRGTGSMSVRNVLVRGTRDVPEVAVALGDTEARGNGVVLHDEATLVVERSAFIDNDGAGVFAGADLRHSTTLTVSDTHVDGALVAIGGAGTGTTVTVQRVIVENATVGLGIGAGLFIASDVRISRVRRHPDIPVAAGVANVFGTLELDAVWVEDMGGVGLLAMNGGSTIARDFVVLRTLPEPHSMRWGRGVWAQTGSRIALERAFLAGNHEVSIGASGVGSDVSLSHVVVHSTLATDGIAAALGAYSRASVVGSHFEQVGSAQMGIQLALFGTADLSHGVVRDNPIGANVQTADFDIGRISATVRYVDNDLNLDSSELPIPGTIPSAF